MSVFYLLHRLIPESFLNLCNQKNEMSFHHSYFSPLPCSESSLAFLLLIELIELFQVLIRQVLTAIWLKDHRFAHFVILTDFLDLISFLLGAFMSLCYP